MAWRLTIGVCAALSAVALGVLASGASAQVTPVQFSALPSGAPLNPDPQDLPRVPTVQLSDDFGVIGGVGDAQDADPYGGGYGYGGNVYLSPPSDRGFPLPRAGKIRPPDLRPPPVFRPQMEIAPPAVGGGQRIIAASF
jgi:hypothetical protein